MVKARARQTPIALIFEDLHWIDGATEDVLKTFIEGTGEIPILIVHTRRPEYEPTWTKQGCTTTLRLTPLPDDEIRHIIEARLGSRALPQDLIQLVIGRAEGNPLYAEEILSYLFDSSIIRSTPGGIEFQSGSHELV